MNNLNTYTITTLLLFSGIAGVSAENYTSAVPELTTATFYSIEFTNGYKKNNEDTEENILEDNLDCSSELSEFLSENNEPQTIFDNDLASSSVNSIESPTSLPEFAIVDEFPEYHLNNYSTLVKYIDNELSSTSENIAGNQENFVSFTNSLATKIAKLNFKESAFEVLPDNKVKFTLLFSNNKSVRITKNISQDIADNKIFYSYFENKKIVSANTNDLDSFINGFNEYLSI
jgi:hypothetical protein